MVPQESNIIRLSNELNKFLASLDRSVLSQFVKAIVICNKFLAIYNTYRKFEYDFVAICNKSTYHNL